MENIIAPSLQTGFARNAGESKYPHFWKGLKGAWIPNLGVTGKTLHDFSKERNDGAFAGGMSWIADEGKWVVTGNGTNGEVDLGVSPQALFGNGGAFTMIVDFKPVFGTIRSIVLAAAADPRFYWGINDTDAVMVGLNDSTNVAFLAGKLVDLERNYMSVSYDGTDMSGTVVNSSGIFSETDAAFVATTYPAGNIIFGGDGGTILNMNSKVRSMLFYDHAMTQSEIYNLSINPLGLVELSEEILKVTHGK